MPSSDTEKLIVRAHQLLHQLRGDHEHIYDSASNPSAVLAAQNVLHDRSAPMLALLEGISAPEVTGLAPVWQLLYFETRSALEFYLASASLSPDYRLEKAKESVADGNKAIDLLKQIAEKNDPVNTLLLENKKKETVRWYQAAAEGIIFHATQNPREKNAAKTAALNFWNNIDPNFLINFPPGPSSYLYDIVPSAQHPPFEIVAGEIHSLIDSAPTWPLVVGVGFASCAAIFLMVLIVLAVIGKSVPPESRPILVFFFALCCAMASGFIGGSLTLRGTLPFFGESPLVVGAVGGLAVLILIILIGNRTWKRHGKESWPSPMGGAGTQGRAALVNSEPSNLEDPLKEE